ncbi:hypothetical protein BDV27DRAFT_149476 [Aspergillus caelatus]|uniref:C2H2-type domain-containing protein n=1 Tax=Aspergillus caelatus TaxID=61420 RepID=A0A5N6ZRH9_9EURO|nr:uncharacterized protein BDV27DRAFT_149476 [Aspergillus caelatus]KAE8359566.1 hypothetical protein BDV27DRAFT_149476 [Aspergillus caelatus]
MSDAPVSTSASSFYVVSSDGHGHNHTNRFPMHNGLWLLADDFNMEPLPPNPAVIPASPVHYPQWQLDVPLHDGSIVPRPTVNHDLEMGLNLRMPTSVQPNSISTAGFSYETGAKDTKESGKNHRPAQRCKWEGCTSTKCFNREADLLRHVKTIHIAPRSYRCNVDGCFKSFNTDDNLKEHILRVHDCDC